MPREEDFFKIEVGAKEQYAVVVEAVVAKAGAKDIERAGPKYPGGEATEKEDGVEGVTSGGKGRRAAQNLPGRACPRSECGNSHFLPLRQVHLLWCTNRHRRARPGTCTSTGGSSPSHYR